MSSQPVEGPLAKKKKKDKGPKGAFRNPVFFLKFFSDRVKRGQKFFSVLQAFHCPTEIKELLSVGLEFPGLGLIKLKPQFRLLGMDDSVVCLEERCASC